MAKKAEPELLKLLNSRAAWNIPRHSEPALDGEYRRRAFQAVEAHAKANPSDPYARDRMALYIKRGLELPSDVYEEAQMRMRAQR